VLRLPRFKAEDECQHLPMHCKPPGLHPAVPELRH
jgi:hypothetical protein